MSANTAFSITAAQFLRPSGDNSPPSSFRSLHVPSIIITTSTPSLRHFQNVCELDIVFNFNKVYSILDEFVLAGEVQETSKKEILERIRELEKLE